MCRSPLASLLPPTPPPPHTHTTHTYQHTQDITALITEAGGVLAAHDSDGDRQLDLAEFSSFMRHFMAAAGYTLHEVIDDLITMAQTKVGGVDWRGCVLLYTCLGVPVTNSHHDTGILHVFACMCVQGVYFIGLCWRRRSIAPAHCLPCPVLLCPTCCCCCAQPDNEKLQKVLAAAEPHIHKMLSQD